MRRTIRSAPARLLATVLVTTASTAATLLVAPPAHAAASVSGAGSTFAQIAIDEWRAGAARKLGLEVNYSGQGSSAGRRSFIEGTVDFASSDIPFEPGETVARGFTYLPLVAGGTALMYNIKDTTGTPVRNLRLSGETVAKIFFGRITRWSAAEIAADNPQLAGKLPSTEVKPVVRSGGSGTTAVFTGYLGAVAPKLWDEFAADPRWRDSIRAGARFTSTFPPGVPGVQYSNGSDGIANFVATQTPGADGSIGYAEAGYAVQRGLPTTSVRNQAGKYVQPGARNQAIALTQATRNLDGTQNLDKVYFYDDPETYPISSYNYMIAPTTGFDPAKGETLGKFIIYAITEGQSKAEPLGYSPLPPNLVQQGLDAVKSIPGAPTPPPLGDWGRYYEQLKVDEPAPEPTAGATGAATGAGATTAAGTAAAAATGSSAAGAAGKAATGSAGAGTTAASAATVAAAKAAAASPAASAAAKKAAAAVARAGGGVVAVDPVTGEVVEGDAASNGGQLALANLVTERRQLSTRDVDVRPSDAAPLFLAGLAIALVVLAPALLAAPAGALLDRRR